MVPELLGNTVLTIGSYTKLLVCKSNNAIAGMADVTLKNIMPIFYNMLIVIGFAIASLAIALVVSKQKRIG